MQEYEARPLGFQCLCAQYYSCHRGGCKNGPVDEVGSLYHGPLCPPPTVFMPCGILSLCGLDLVISFSRIVYVKDGEVSLLRLGYK